MAFSKERKFQIVQFLIMAALLAFIILMLLSGHSKEVDMPVIEQRMEEMESVSLLTKKTMGDAAQQFSVDATLLEDGIYYRVDDVMDVNELFIVRIDNDAARQSVIDAVMSYLAEKTASFNGYGTNQFGLLSSAITTEKGEYFFFGVSEDAVEWESAFLECVR